MDLYLGIWERKELIKRVEVKHPNLEELSIHNVAPFEKGENQGFVNEFVVSALDMNRGQIHGSEWLATTPCCECGVRRKGVKCFVTAEA